MAVIEEIHGRSVSDPFRWLEDSEASEVQHWTAAQNARTRALLDAYPARDALLARIKALLDLGSLSAPTLRPTKSGIFRYFHTRRGSGDNHGVFYVRDGDDGFDRPLIDVSVASRDETASLDWTAPSPHGTFVAWGGSTGGTEDSTLYVRDVATGADLVDVIPHTRYASLAWLPDERGFFYTRYPERGSVPSGDERYWRRVYFHRLGSHWRDDALVYPSEDEQLSPGNKTAAPRVVLSPNGRWLFVRVHLGAERSRLFFRDLWGDTEASFREVAPEVEARFDPIVRDTALYLVTNHGAMRGRLMAVDYASPEPSAWRQIIPERQQILRGCSIAGGVIVARYLEEAGARLERFTLEGEALGSLELPAQGTASVRASPDAHEAFVHFSSFTNPGEVLAFDLVTGRGRSWGRVGEGLGNVSVSRLYATSKDGTRVPMFVVEAKGSVRDGERPTILTGYGGFNQIASPAFNPCAALAAERGVVWVQALLRGGGELGDSWHRAGTLGQKQNTFDDFIACAERLVEAGVTNPERLGIMGSSNGGLLTAAVAMQRPELFRAALADVPLTDMLRYHLYRMGRLWISEYGCADDPAQFAALYAYSPYHQVRGGVQYPAMLFATAASDSRVDPMHARKMAARMQADATSDDERPILLRVEDEAGHGAGKPMSKLALELADWMTFMFRSLGVA